MHLICRKRKREIKTTPTRCLLNIKSIETKKIEKRNRKRKKKEKITKRNFNKRCLLAYNSNSICCVQRITYDLRVVWGLEERVEKGHGKGIEGHMENSASGLPYEKLLQKHEVKFESGHLHTYVQHCHMQQYVTRKFIGLFSKTGYIPFVQTFILFFLYRTTTLEISIILYQLFSSFSFSSHILIPNVEYIVSLN